MTNSNEAHVAQGRTVDTGHLVCLGVARDQLYVGMSRSRGRQEAEAEAELRAEREIEDPEAEID